jgi:hypothetical protein
LTPIPPVVQGLDESLLSKELAAKIKLDTAARVASYTQSAAFDTRLALGNLPTPIISSPEAMADRLQIAALKGDDLQAENYAKMIQGIEKVGGLIKEVKDVIRETRLLPQWMY